MKRPQDVSPYETVLSGASRFGVELLALIAGSWAVAGVSIRLAVPAILLLVVMPGVFSTPGDKKRVFVPTPGPYRLGIELVLHVVAAGGAWVAWPVWWAMASTVVVAVSLISGMPRMRWLFRGAPLP